jgi:hypothetical protein
VPSLTRSDDAATDRNAAAQIQADEPHNFLLLALTTATIRVGWIFKTESVIIPAFLDSIAGPGWLRGMLPVLNRIGQSIPPFLLARRIKLMPQKRHSLAVSCVCMGACFMLLAWAISAGLHEAAVMTPVLFLALYTLFFSFTGIHVITLGTLQGKLIRANHRGRLLALATMGGTIPAVGFAWWLLPDWLAQGMAGYMKIFAFTGFVMSLAGGVALFLREPNDDLSEPVSRVLDQFKGAWEILCQDASYRRLVIVGALFTTSLMLLPHYQSLGRLRLGLQSGDMMLWVIAQNITIGIASVLMGPMADRLGNRLSIRIVIFASALVPPLALVLSRLEPEQGRELFALVFVGVGLTPIGLRLLTNYILEFAPATDHPRYLSISQLCTAAVISTSPLFGMLVDRIGYEWVFIAITGLMALGGVLTFRLVEPRHREP